MSKLVFAAAVLLVGLVIHGALRRRAEGLPPGLRTVGSRVVLLLAIGVPAVILFFSVFRIIPAGHVGVKVLFGQVDPTPLREGLNVVLNPLYDIVVMDGRVGKHSARYDAASKDLQAVHVEMVLNYQLHPDRAPEVYKSIGLDYSGGSAVIPGREGRRAEPPLVRVLLRV
jgi:regulator of protease activity HflC (stomatin/prohibitin superfamily)